MSLFPLGLISQGGGASGGGPNAMELISTQILSSTATQINLNSIPSTYKHLQLRFVGNTTTLGYTLQFQFNGATSGYSWHILCNNNSNGYTESSTSTNAIRMSSSFNDLGALSTAIMDITDYADTTKYKTARILYGAEDGSSNRRIMLASGLYQSTSAISSIVVLGNTGTFAIGTRVSLYGVKGTA